MIFKLHKEEFKICTKYDQVVYIVYGLTNCIVEQTLFSVTYLSEKSCQRYKVFFFDGVNFYTPMVVIPPLPKDDYREGSVDSKKVDSPDPRFKMCEFLQRTSAYDVFRGMTTSSKIVWGSHGDLGPNFEFSSLDDVGSRPIFNAEQLGKSLAKNINQFNPGQNFYSSTSCLTIDLQCCDAGVSHYGEPPVALVLRKTLFSDYIKSDIVARPGEYSTKGFVNVGCILLDREKYTRRTTLDDRDKIIEEGYRKAPYTKLMFTACRQCGCETALWMYEYAFFLRTFILMMLNNYSSYTTFDITALKNAIPLFHNPRYLVAFLAYRANTLNIPSEFQDSIITPVIDALNNLHVCPSCFRSLYDHFTRHQLYTLERLFRQSCHEPQF